LTNFHSAMQFRGLHWQVQVLYLPSRSGKFRYLKKPAFSLSSSQKPHIAHSNSSLAHAAQPKTRTRETLCTCFRTQTFGCFRVVLIGVNWCAETRSDVLGFFQIREIVALLLGFNHCVVLVPAFIFITLSWAPYKNFMNSAYPFPKLSLPASS